MLFLRLRLRLGRGEVAAARPDDHELIEHEVPYLDDAAGDGGQSSCAAVLDDPLRPAHGRRAVATLRPELALARAPEPALLLRVQARLRGAAAGEVADQRQLGHERL